MNYACPECGCTDTLEVMVKIYGLLRRRKNGEWKVCLPKRVSVVQDRPYSASCYHCGWEGALKDL